MNQFQSNPYLITKQSFRTPTLERVDSKYGRLYKLLPDGRLVPGVTTILEIIAKQALIFWAASEERNHCKESARIAFQEVMDSDFVTVDGVMQHALTPDFPAILEERIGRSFACVRKTRDAANVGTEAHAAIERAIREQLGQSVGPFPALSDGAHIAYMAFEDWAKSVNFEPLAAEVIVSDGWHGYAGTIDFVARVNGVLTVGDWKTGKAIYKESFLQNAAYLNALRKLCRLGDEPIQGAIIRFPKLLEDVSEFPFEVKLLTPEDQKINFLAFLKAMDLWKWLKQGYDAKPSTAATLKPAMATTKWVKPISGPTGATQPRPATPGRVNPRPANPVRLAPAAGVAVR